MFTQGFRGSSPTAALKDHLTRKHKSWTIPGGALTPFDLLQCPHLACGKLFWKKKKYDQCRTSHTQLANAVAPSRVRPQNDDGPPTEDASIDYGGMISKNRMHLGALEMNPSVLMRVQGAAYTTPPGPVAILLDAFYAQVFQEMIDDLDDTTPTVMLAASTRYLLAPPRGDDDIGDWPVIFRARLERLGRGEGEEHKGGALRLSFRCHV